MKTDLIPSLLEFLEKEKINITLREVSNSEFWLERDDDFLAARFVIKKDDHSILYDIFSPKYDIHFREETIRDVERLESILEQKGEWDYEKPIEDLWLLLDITKIWAKKNGFNFKETHLI